MFLRCQGFIPWLNLDIFILAIFWCSLWKCSKHTCKIIQFSTVHVMICKNFWDGHISLYSGDLTSGLVWISKNYKRSWFAKVRILNGILNPVAQSVEVHIIAMAKAITETFQIHLQNTRFQMFPDFGSPLYIKGRV